MASDQAQDTRPVHNAGDPVVETALGRLRGRRAHGVFAFKGIRYGETTGDANRFLPPVPPAAWSGIRDAATFGASAPQTGAGLGPLGGWYDRLEPISEDCLFLNVWTASIGDARRPVMVWLHGGGWNSCAGTAPGFEGAHLARAGDVVVVTVNHRLNGFGFLALDDPDPRFADSGVVGMLDLVAALRWVRDNIAAFGGDPANVTIFGQSGGAAKVCALLGLPAARGLFHKAIVQSCSGGQRLAGLEEARRRAHDLAEKLGLSQLTGAALQQVPMRRLAEAIGALANPFRAVKDGRNYQHDPFDPVATPLAADIPLLIGNAATEATFFLAVDMANFALDAAEVERRVSRFLDIDTAATRRIIDAYRAAGAGATPSEALIAIASDYMYRRNTTRVAELQAGTARAKVFAYLFTWRTPVQGGVFGSPHTIEVPFAFGTTEAASVMVGTDPVLPRLEKTTMAYWASFAHDGVPAAPGMAEWPPYDPTRRHTMLLDVEPRLADDPDGERRHALDALPYFEYGRTTRYVRP